MKNLIGWQRKDPPRSRPRFCLDLPPSAGHSFLGDLWMPKDPWFKFYPTDWDSDVKLQSCSLAAQGLLMKLMCMMHQSPKPGYLLIGSSAPTWAQVGRVGRVPHNTLCKYLNELLENGVLVEEDGVLVCQRMVRDQAYRESQAEHGKKGGNPKLTGKTHKGSLIPRSQKPETRSQKEITTTEVKSMSGKGDSALALVPATSPTKEQAREVLSYLNQRYQSAYKPVDKTLEPIIARLKEGHTVEECKTVIDGQMLDPYFLENPKFYRPDTLFRATKFASYLQAAPKLMAGMGKDPKQEIDRLASAERSRKWAERMEKKDKQRELTNGKRKPV